MRKNIESGHCGVVELLALQDIAPYFLSKNAHELEESYQFGKPFEMAIDMYMLGYIEGKRAERARRKAVHHDGSH